jgi:hypothetical protein
MQSDADSAVVDRRQAHRHQAHAFGNRTGDFMTAENTGSSNASTAPQWNLERINRLITDLEQELAMAPDHDEVQRLRHEIEILRTALNASAGRDVNDEDLHSARSSFQRMSAAVENEVLKDSPYIAEIGRILGMV